MALITALTIFGLIFISASLPTDLRPDTVTNASENGPQPGQIKNLYTPGDNGTAWPVFAERDGPFDLYAFAKSRATCSNNLTNKPFPSVFEGQFPEYFAEATNGTIALNPNETMYTLWIGTNDVGVSALLTGDQAPSVTLFNTVSCAVNWVTTLHANGARNFLFQNETVLYNYNT